MATFTKQQAELIELAAQTSMVKGMLDKVRFTLNPKLDPEEQKILYMAGYILNRFAEKNSAFGIQQQMELEELNKLISK